jgi:ketosteroid isomerase-like protein
MDRALVERVLRTFESKDIDAILSCFADDAVFFDPHYPSPMMPGKEAMRQGFQIAFGMIKQPGFAIRKMWADDNSCAVEVDTHHTFINGTTAHFPQVFIMEARGGLLTRLQAYAPYPHPPPAAPAPPNPPAPPAPPTL